MTEQLYLTDAYLVDFTAVVTDVEEAERRFATEPFEVLEAKRTASGVAGAQVWKIRFEDGARAKVKWKEAPRYRGDGWNNSPRREVAAYEVSRLLGLDNVPPATMRTLGGRGGSIQLWIESAQDVRARLAEGIDERFQQLWVFQKQNMAVFDNLIYNFDRNPGNMLLDSRGKVWFVDHTRAFKTLPSLNQRGDIKVVERELWQNLQELDPELVRERLGPYLRQTEIDALLVRRDKLVKLIAKRVAKHGEQAIIFEFVRS